MANVNIPDLTSLTDPATDDEIEVYDASASQNKRLALARLVRNDNNGAQITGGGTLALAGFTLTVPATGTAALRGAANTFTAGQTFTPASGIAITVNTVAGSSSIFANNIDLGNDVAGPSIAIGRNTNAGAAGPAAGALLLNGATVGGSRRIWSDNSGNLRIHTAAPTGSTGSPTIADTAGTVVGTQTSWHAAKEAIVSWDGVEALDAINALNLYSYQMINDGHKTTDGDKPTYYGIVIQDEDREANAWFGLGYGDQQIPALNDRNLCGYMLAAIQQLSASVDALQSQLDALQSE